MYYFYINYPNFKDRIILIHHGDCSQCQNGNGMHEAGSNEKGFWAGPFKKYDHAAIALAKLVAKFRNPPETGDCGCI